MEEIFFSKQNFNIIYNIIKKNIYNNTEFDISTDDNYRNKYIYVVEYLLSGEGEYIKQDNLFSGQYLIEK